MKVTEEPGEKVVRTVCLNMCSHGCAMLAHVRDGVLVKVEPAELPGDKTHRICARGLCNPKLVYHPDRLKYPMKRLGERGEGKWQRISWEEALETAGSRLKEIAERHGADSVAWTVIPMGLLPMAYSRLASTWGGTWVTIEGYGDSAGPCADKVSYGTGFMPGGITYTTSYENPGLCAIWGLNQAVTEPRSFLNIRNARERGARVVVIDPRFTPTAAKADEWIPIRPGTDAALALGMMDVIISQGLEDKSFIVDYTVGPFLVRVDNGLFVRGKDITSMEPTDSYIVWDSITNKPQAHDSPGVSPALRGSYTIDGVECKPAFQLLAELAEQYPVEKASEITEVAPETIKKLAMDYVRLKPVNSYRGMGAQRTFHGHLSWRAITALAAITGNITLTPFCVPILNLIPFIYPLKTPRLLPLMDMLHAIVTGKPYPIKALWITRHNLVNQMPDANKIINELFPRLEFIVVSDMFMSATAEYADMVLPACTYMERTDLFMSYDLPKSLIQLQQKVIEPLYESRSDFQIVKDLAAKLGVGEHFDKSEEEFIEMILSSEHPSMEGVTLDKLRKGLHSVPPYPRPAFRTPSRRIEFYTEDQRLKELGESLPVFKEPLEGTRQPMAKKYPLSLLTTHTKYRTHSLFANIDWLREIEPEPVLEINPVDAAERAIRDGDMVVAFNDRGWVKVKAMFTEGIKPGVVNVTQGWWPQDFAGGRYNALTRDDINPAQQAMYEANAAHLDVLVEVKKAEEE